LDLTRDLPCRCTGPLILQQLGAQDIENGTRRPQESNPRDLNPVSPTNMSYTKVSQ
jgi:hypothetical protein